MTAPVDIALSGNQSLSSIHLEPAGAGVAITCRAAGGGTVEMSTSGAGSAGSEIGANPTGTVAGNGGQGTVSENGNPLMTFTLRVEADGIPILTVAKV